MNMKQFARFSVLPLMLATGCSNLSKTENGALAGGGIGAVTGALIGKTTGHTAGGAAIGAGVAGSLMDRGFELSTRIYSKLPSSSGDRGLDHRLTGSDNGEGPRATPDRVQNRRMGRCHSDGSAHAKPGQ